MFNSNILSTKNVGQGSSSQLKHYANILQQKRLVVKFTTKIKNKFCFQTSFKKFKILKELKHKSSHVSHRCLLFLIKHLYAEYDDVCQKLILRCLADDAVGRGLTRDGANNDDRAYLIVLIYQPRDILYEIWEKTLCHCIFQSKCLWCNHSCKLFTGIRSVSRQFYQIMEKLAI